MQDGSSPTFDDARELFIGIGKHPVFLHINAGEKGPEWKGWPKKNYEETLEADYQRLLRTKPNTGVLLGAPSEDLCAIDFDCDAALNAFLEINPTYQTALRTRGSTGAQLWAYITGERPHKVCALKVHQDSPLAAGARLGPDKQGMVQVGEFRAEGVQSVIRGIHPSGGKYTWAVAAPPITIAFSQIRWPNDIAIPWEEERKEQPKIDEARKASENDNDLLKRAIALISVDKLWTHFGFPERRTNPVASPFRDDNTPDHPSFSVYDQGRRFKDHNAAYEHHRGDSFDFYQLAVGLDTHGAFEGFVELAGLGAELFKNQPKEDTGPFAGIDEETSKEKPGAEEDWQQYTERKKREAREETSRGGNGNKKRDDDERSKTFELELVERLASQLPPLITQGNVWRIYDDGVWVKRELATYQPEALDIIEPKYRTVRLATAVLRHIQGKFQIKESPFCGAYKFDGNDVLVSVANGVMRISPTDEPVIEPFSPDHHFTQKLAVPFNPDAVPKAFSNALTQNLREPKDRQLFGMFCASAFVPDCRWEAALCCFGQAGTGKSTLFEGIEAMFGVGPCQALSLTQLCDPESYNGHDLEFAMLNFSTELNALELTSDRFKQLVSGERVPVRPIYAAPYYIKPTCKYAFLTNHLPRFRDGTDAELRRLYFLKFNQIPKTKDLELKKQIALEGAGILNLLVRLVPQLLKLAEMPRGADQSEAARERFKVANDPVGVFVKAECNLDPDAFETKDKLEARFKSFLSHQGLNEKIAPVLFKQLYDRFTLAPVRPRMGGERVHGVSGIELKSVTET